jgi:predicted small secreted protein
MYHLVPPRAVLQATKLVLLEYHIDTGRWPHAITKDEQKIQIPRGKERFMKTRLVLCLFLLACLALLAACGGASGSGTSQVEKNTAVGTATGTSSNKYVDHITITDKSIQSSLTTFNPNVPYLFTVSNKSGKPRSFLIVTKPSGANINLQHNDILYSLNSNQLPAGASKTFTYEFQISTPQSHIEFATYLTGQNGNGMVLPVVVQKVGSQ